MLSYNPGFLMETCYKRAKLGDFTYSFQETKKKTPTFR